MQFDNNLINNVVNTKQIAILTANIVAIERIVPLPTANIINETGIFHF